MLIDGFPQPHHLLPSTNAGLGSELLVAFVNANSADMNGNTVLINAAIANNIGLARVLLEDGADVNAQNVAGSTALHHAALRGHLEIVRLLLKASAEPNIQNKQDETPMICAAYAGRYSVISLLAQWGADPELCDAHGRNALTWAIIRGHIRAVEELLRTRSRVNSKEIDKLLLNLAASLGHGEIFRLLLDAQQNKLSTKRGEFILDF